MENFNIKNIKAIIGLGNPGQKYYKNRHNIGFRIVDKIAQNFDSNWITSNNLEYCKINLDDKTLYLVKPQTFMNNSGQALSFLTKKGIKAEEILVIDDELEKKFGQIILKNGGSSKGHNGLKSLIGGIGENFWRLRFGIDRPLDRAEVSDYVLSNFKPEEESEIDNLIEKAVGLVLKNSPPFLIQN